MKQTIITAMVIFSIASCTHPGDNATTSTGPDSSAMGRGVGDSAATSNSPNGINGDTAMQRQGVSAGSSDSSGRNAAGDPASINSTVDTASGRGQSANKSGTASKDTARGKRNHYNDSSKRKQ